MNADQIEYLNRINEFVIAHRNDLEAIKPLQQWTSQEIMKAFLQWQMELLNRIQADDNTADEVITLI
jgi:hypothetical protein